MTVRTGQIARTHVVGPSPEAVLIAGRTIRAIAATIILVGAIALTIVMNMGLAAGSTAVGATAQPAPAPAVVNSGPTTANPYGPEPAPRP